MIWHCLLDGLSHARPECLGWVGGWLTYVTNAASAGLGHAVGLAASARDSAGPNANPARPSAVWPVLLLVTRAGIGAMVLGIVLCVYRILRGPNLSDRVLSADVLSLLLVALVILLMIETNNTVFIDAALVVAIIGFASTVAFAQYIGARPEDGNQSRVQSYTPTFGDTPEDQPGAEGRRG